MLGPWEIVQFLVDLVTVQITLPTLAGKNIISNLCPSTYHLGVSLPKVVIGALQLA